MSKKNLEKEKWMPIFVMAVILIVIYIALGHLDIIGNAIKQFLRILSPLLLGILFAYFLYSPLKRLENLVKKAKIKKFTFIADRARGISTVIVFLILIALIAFLLAFVIPIIVSSIVDLANSIPVYIQAITQWFNSIPEDSVFADINIGLILQDNAGRIIDTLLGSISTIQLDQATGAVTGFLGGILNFILGLFLSLYILLYRSEMKEYFVRLNNAVFKNERKRDTVTRYFKQTNEVLLTFIASKSIDALCNFAAATVVTTIFGVPYSLLLGLMAGVLNFIPYIGSIISSAIITLLALLTCPLPIALSVFVSIFAFQQFDGNFIEPRIFKTSLKLNPILVIMAVVIGGAYFGPAGMFLAVPISVILKQLINEYIESSEKLVPVDEKEEDIRR